MIKKSSNKLVYKLMTKLCFTFLLLQSFSAYSQWPATCAAASYYDCGLITPGAAALTVPPGCCNTWNSAPTVFVKAHFAGTAGVKYCFCLGVFGSGETYNGNEIQIFKTNCVANSGTIELDSWSAGNNTGNINAGGTGPNCVVFTCTLTTTYYILLSDGSCNSEACGAMFGASGSETVKFVYAIAADASPCGIILPIELAKFEAKQQGTETKLEWTTTTETNNSYFAIERSQDGVFFEEIGTTKGAGNSLQAINYSSVDKNPAPGLNYYRLKQTDFNGKSKYSTIVTVDFLTVRPHLSNLHPNPTSNDVSFNMYSPNKANGRIEVLDISGRVISSVQQDILIGNQSITTPLNELAKGIYYFKISIDELGFFYTAKLIKN